MRRANAIAQGRRRLLGPADTSSVARVGIYTGNLPADITAFETWFGEPIQQIMAFTGEADWSDYETSVSWVRGQFESLNRPIMFSVPLLAAGGTLAAGATGAYDTHYQSAAQDLATLRPSDPVIYIRTAWEFNGSTDNGDGTRTNWMKWGALGKEADFILTWRHFVDTFRAVSSRFRFDWCPSLGNVGMNPEMAYPGDGWVDVVGLDVYYFPQWDGNDAGAAFDDMITEQYGLQWQVNFAAAHGKNLSFPEWGIRTDQSGPFISKLRDWTDTHNFLYHNYWESNSAYPGQLRLNQYPTAGAVWRQEFTQIS
jgi:glycosyl hydrolase family 26